jgi:hypothetical protein
MLRMKICASSLPHRRHVLLDAPLSSVPNFNTTATARAICARREEKKTGPASPSSYPHSPLRLPAYAIPEIGIAGSLLLATRSGARRAGQPSAALFAVGASASRGAEISGSPLPLSGAGTLGARALSAALRAAVASTSRSNGSQCVDSPRESHIMAIQEFKNHKYQQTTKNGYYKCVSRVEFMVWNCWYCLIDWYPGRSGCPQGQKFAPDRHTKKNKCIASKCTKNSKTHLTVNSKPDPYLGRSGWPQNPKFVTDGHTKT